MEQDYTKAFSKGQKANSDKIATKGKDKSWELCWRT
jgi:hypothetical protein